MCGGKLSGRNWRPHTWLKEEGARRIAIRHSWWGKGPEPVHGLTEASGSHAEGSMSKADRPRRAGPGVATCRAVGLAKAEARQRSTGGDPYRLFIPYFSISLKSLK